MNPNRLRFSVPFLFFFFFVVAVLFLFAFLFPYYRVDFEGSVQFSSLLVQKTLLFLKRNFICNGTT